MTCGQVAGSIGSIMRAGRRAAHPEPGMDFTFIMTFIMTFRIAAYS